MSTEIQNELPFSRRDMLKGGGALIIGFSLSGLPGPAAAARGDVAAHPIPTRSTPGSRSMPTTRRPFISGSASLARATPLVSCRSSVKSLTST
jgi:hypothetical protein